MCAICPVLVTTSPKVITDELNLACAGRSSLDEEHTSATVHMELPLPVMPTSASIAYRLLLVTQLE